MKRKKWRQCASTSLPVGVSPGPWGFPRARTCLYRSISWGLPRGCKNSAPKATAGTSKPMTAPTGWGGKTLDSGAGQRGTSAAAGRYHTPTMRRRDRHESRTNRQGARDRARKTRERLPTRRTGTGTEQSSRRAPTAGKDGRTCCATDSERLKRRSDAHHPGRVATHVHADAQSERGHSV